VPIQALGLAAGDKVLSYLTFTRGGNELGRWPADAALVLAYAGPELGAEPAQEREREALDAGRSGSLGGLMDR